VPRVTIRMLGELEVRVGGRVVELPGRKVQALLARLARRPGEAVPRATLAALLWPDRGDEQARGSLRQAVAALRRALGDDALAAGADVLALHPQVVSSDVAAFEAAPADPERFSGPFLEGFPPVEEPFDDWVHAERARLVARALEAFRAALDAAVAAGAEGGLGLAERALAIDPAFEPAYRARMRLLAARGDRAGALREHARCAEALSRALGVEPSPETEALRREVAAQAAPAAGSADPRGLPVLAVLPFELRSSDDPAHGAFARGLAEDVLLELSRFRSLRVLSVGEGGHAAGADWLLLGAVQAAGGRLRAGTRLVEAASGRQVWAERFDADLADLLDVQERIARSVAAALSLRIDGEALERTRGRAPEALDAYALWLAGMAAMRRGTREADLEARALFERALAREPGFARAHVGLSLSHFNDWSCAAWERWDENEREAWRHAEAAIRLDERDHVAHCILGRILLYRREFDRGEGHLRRALALNASDPDVLAHLAIGFAYLGLPEEGTSLVETARRLNPADPEWYVAVLALNHLVAGRAREALALLARAPDAYVDTRALLAAAQAHAGDLAAAREDAARFLARFRRSIAPGAATSEAIGWVLRVTPLRRAEDRAWLVDGLVRAGLPGAAAATPPSAASAR
jgi:DNA-binding SARP family transcriptional activator